ncbi:MAG: hypothetical protein CR991_03290 [Proteobacteria bacterium]|nr:MAG: hypothetical protein CR991_03290 [Pseudomonadota bacterium]
MAYLLDANIFIQASNLHYGFDFCPAFWEWLDEANAAGTVLSISQVQDEMVEGNDELADWAKAKGSGFFKETDTATLPRLGAVAQWVQSNGYEAAAINTFLQVADYYLISYALAHGHTIVTHEVPANTPKKIKIPNVCVGFGISCISPYAMLRREGARFVLGR